MPASLESESDTVMAGKRTLMIEYSDYRIESHGALELLLSMIVR